MIIALAQELGFPREAIQALRAGSMKIENTVKVERPTKPMLLYMWEEPTRMDKLKEKFADAGEALFAGQDWQPLVAEVAEEAELHPYTADMVFLLFAALTLREKYRESGYPDDIFVETMEDLRFKLFECWQVYGVWGTFVGSWYTRFFSLELFRVGRLEYEWTEMRCDHPKLKAGERVLNCHIPSCGPLEPRAVIDSLRRAYDFFDYDDAMPVVCNSWLLYPPHLQIFPEGGNLRAFYEMFEVLEEKRDPENKNLWRISGRADGVIPTDTALRRNLKAYLDAGNCMGSGYGILFFNGRKIIK